MVFSDTIGNKVAFGGIRVDGRILVDAANESEFWSNKATVGSSPQTGYPLTYAFNGDVNIANCWASLILAALWTCCLRSLLTPHLSLSTTPRR